MASEDTDTLLDRALKLPPEARAALAGTLLESLEVVIDDEAEELWSAEIQHRLQELRSGSVKVVPWPEARRQILSG